MNKEDPPWEADTRLLPFRTPTGENTVYYLVRKWPDGGEEAAIMVEKSCGRGKVARWVRIGSNGRDYCRLLKR